jgi:hypothetical protein
MHTRQPTRRLTRLVLLMAVCGACALASAALAGNASAIVPPPGTPDLSQMVLVPSDFASGARITRSAYITTPGLVANYERDFAGGRTLGGAKFAYASSEAALAEDTLGAEVFFTLIEVAVSLPGFRQVIAHELTNESRLAGKRSHVRPRDIHLGSVRSLHVGDASILLPVSIRVHGVRSSTDVVFLRVNRAIGGFALFGARIAPGDATSLAGRMADRIRTGLSPLNGIAPLIGGTATQGQTLVASSGTWSNGPTSFAYQWQRCDAVDANCTPIAGASGQSYTLTAADAAATIRVSVTATNAVGPSKAATSTPTAIVQ